MRIPCRAERHDPPKIHDDVHSQHIAVERLRQFDVTGRYVWHDAPDRHTELANDGLALAWQRHGWQRVPRLWQTIMSGGPWAPPPAGEHCHCRSKLRLPLAAKLLGQHNRHYRVVQ